MNVKRLIRRLMPVLLLLFVLLLAGAASAGNGTTMRVSHCNEWVSLRVAPNTESGRLAKVPLGAPVLNCGEETDGFIPCEYRGKSGYILAKYLEPVTDFSFLRRWHDFATVEGIGQPLDDFTDAAGRRVLVRRFYGEGENICAVVYDAKLQYLTAMWSSSEEIGQFPVMTAFAGGPQDDPYLLWFDGDYLSAYAVGSQMPDDQLWSLPLSGAGMSHAVDTDGTIYLIGYDQDILTCVSADGRLLWRTPHSDPDVYWPYQIDIGADQVDVTYEEGGAHDGTPAVVSFSKEDGRQLGTEAGATAGSPGSARTGSLSNAQGGLPSGQLVRVQFAEGLSIGPHFELVVGTETPLLKVLFSASATVTDFEILALDTEIAPDGTERISAQSVGKLPSLMAQTPLLVSMSFIGDTPNNGFRYRTADGELHSFVLDLSGENGGLICRPFGGE